MLGPRTQVLQPQGHPRALRCSVFGPAWLTRTEHFAGARETVQVWNPSLIQSGPGLGPGHTGNKDLSEKRNHTDDEACSRPEDPQREKSRLMRWGGRSPLVHWREERVPGGRWGEEPALDSQAGLEQRDAGGGGSLAMVEGKPGEIELLTGHTGCLRSWRTPHFPL